MIDRQLRDLVRRPLDRAAAGLERLGISANHVTLVGFGCGLGGAICVGLALFPIGLALWLANRLLDGLDGALARRKTPSDLGGFLDIVSDFFVYGAFIVGIAIAEPASRLAALALFLTYYVSGTAFLALSALFEKRRRENPDCRSIHFVGGIAEGFETVLVYVALCLLPTHAAIIMWLFAGAVAITALQRVYFGVKGLRQSHNDAPRSTPQTLTEHQHSSLRRNREPQH